MSQDVYGEPIIIQRPNGIDIVSHPILTDEVRAGRMREIEKAAAALLISEYERKKRNENPWKILSDGSWISSCPN